MARRSEGFWIYKLLIDPLTSSLRRSVVEKVEPGSRVLDIACGTGSLLFDLSPNISEGIGIDLDGPKMEEANELARIKKVSNIKFVELNALDLSNNFSERFDYVILSLAIHQFPESLRKDIMKQALSSGNKLIIADYSVPVPANFPGFMARLIERIAGKEHFNAFRSFVRQKGINGIQGAYKLDCLSTSKTSSGVFTISKFTTFEDLDNS